MPKVNFAFQSVDATLTSGVIRVWSPSLRPGGTAAITGEPSWVNLVDGKASMVLEPGPVVGKITGNGRTHDLAFTVPSQDDAVDFLDLLGDTYDYEPEIVRAAQQAAREARQSASSAADSLARVQSTVGSAERVLQAEAAAKVSEEAAATSAGESTSSASEAASSASAASSSASAAAGSATEAQTAAASAVSDVTSALSSMVSAAEAAETAAAGSATAAASSASTAQERATSAEGSATRSWNGSASAVAARDAAVAAKSGAQSARDSAASSATAAAGSASAAANSATTAQGAAGAAASDVRDALAADVSASQAARSGAEAAAVSADDSADRAEAAAASAAEVVSSGVPDATTALKGKVKLAGDLSGTAEAPTVPGLATKADKATTDPVVAKVNAAAVTPTADTLALRDGSGRLSVAPPTADGHAATKAYTDSKVSSTAVTLTGDQSVAGVKTFATTPTVGGVALVKNDDVRLTDSRTPTTHTHTTAQVDGLDTALASKAATTAMNARPALFSGAGAAPSTIAGAVVGDWWLNTSTMELSKITGV